MRRRLAFLSVVAVVLLSGCGGEPPAPTGPAVPSAPVSAGSTSAADPGVVTAPLLAFTGTTIDGAPFDGRSLAGKPAVLWFWAPWCPTCLRQATGVRAAAEQYGDQVTIVGVAGLDKAAAMPEFVRRAKIEPITNLSDESGTVWRHFGITSQSTFVLLDAAGNEKSRGALPADEVPARVRELLSPPGAPA